MPDIPWDAISHRHKKHERHERRALFARRPGRVNLLGFRARKFTLEQLHFDLGVVQDGVVGGLAAPQTKPFLQIRIPADVQVFHWGEGCSTASQNCISCLNVGQAHQRFALRRWIVSPPYELQLRTVASRRLPNLLSVGIRPAHQSKDGDDTKEPCRFRLIHPAFAIPPPPGGHAHRCESDRCAAPRDKSV